MKYEKIRKQVLEAILQAVEQGLINGTSGNIALRDDEDDVVAITPSGVAYGTMKPEDIAIVDLNGKWMDGPYNCLLSTSDAADDRLCVALGGWLYM